MQFVILLYTSVYTNGNKKTKEMVTSEASEKPHAGTVDRKTPLCRMSQAGEWAGHCSSFCWNKGTQTQCKPVKEQWHYQSSACSSYVTPMQAHTYTLTDLVQYYYSISKYNCPLNVRNHSVALKEYEFQRVEGIWKSKGKEAILT